MDSLLEIIGPLVIAAIYFLANAFSKKEDADDGSSPQRGEQDFEDADFQRLVQEDERRRDIVRRRQSGQDSQTVQVETLQERAPVPSPVIQRQDDGGGFSWNESDDSYDNQMERQLKKIEATKRKAAQLMSKTAQGGAQSAKETDSSRQGRKKSSFGSVRSSLKNPGAARSAFIYGEVLGPAVSQRKTTGVPGLSS
jgi:hypothetical protein